MRRRRCCGRGCPRRRRAALWRGSTDTSRSKCRCVALQGQGSGRRAFCDRGGVDAPAAEHLQPDPRTPCWVLPKSLWSMPTYKAFLACRRSCSGRWRRWQRRGRLPRPGQTSCSEVWRTFTVVCGTRRGARPACRARQSGQRRAGWLRRRAGWPQRRGRRAWRMLCRNPPARSQVRPCQGSPLRLNCAHVIPAPASAAGANAPCPLPSCRCRPGDRGLGAPCPRVGGPVDSRGRCRGAAGRAGAAWGAASADGRDEG